MVFQSMYVRVLCALLAVAVVGVVDWNIRPERVKAAQASVPAPSESLLSAGLKQAEHGTIPMPEGALAAHASTLLAMPAGGASGLTAFWFAGDRESAPNVQIAAAQWHRATQRWSAARFVVNRHVLGTQLGFGVRRLGNPVAWLDAQQRVHLFVVATGWGGWAASRIVHLQQASDSSRLEHLRFEPVRILPLSWLWNTSFLVRNTVMPLQDGGMVLPVHFELGIKYPVALRFDRNGEFSGMVRMSQRRDVLQPALVMQSPTEWIAFLRAQRSSGKVGVVQSTDGGVHWSDLPDLALDNPDAAVAALRLGAWEAERFAQVKEEPAQRAGDTEQNVLPPRLPVPQRLVLAHNPSTESRIQLDLSTSTDGVSWQTLGTLARGGEGDEFSYPSMALADGSLWVSYTQNRKRIAWQRWDSAPAAAKGSP
jgi:predicted neuraminidase